jgi:hypothetical protein
MIGGADAEVRRGVGAVVVNIGRSDAVFTVNMAFVENVISRQPDFQCVPKKSFSTPTVTVDRLKSL